MRFAKRVLFPGYVLAGFSRYDERWQMIRNIDGVNGILAAEGCPIRRGEHDIGDLMARCITRYFDIDQRRICTTADRLTPHTVCDHVTPHRGNKALLWSGPFQSLCEWYHSRVSSASSELERRRSKISRICLIRRR